MANLLGYYFVAYSMIMFAKPELPPPISCRERTGGVRRGGELREPALQHHSARRRRPRPTRPLLPQRLQSPHLHVSTVTVTIWIQWQLLQVPPSQKVSLLGAVHKWRQLNFWDFVLPPSLSVPNTHNLPSSRQKLANPLPPPLYRRHLWIAPKLR